MIEPGRDCPLDDECESCGNTDDTLSWYDDAELWLCSDCIGTREMER
jgi:hypothetical protein